MSLKNFVTSIKLILMILILIKSNVFVSISNVKKNCYYNFCYFKLIMNYEVPIDKSRFFLELVKFNEDTLIRTSFFPFLRNFIEINYNKGFITINSPYLSGLIEILTNNSQDIFRSLSYTFFKIKTIKRNIIENFLSIGIGWLKHVRFIALTNKKIKPYKKKKFLINLFSLEKKKNLFYKR